MNQPLDFLLTGRKVVVELLSLADFPNLNGSIKPTSYREASVSIGILGFENLQHVKPCPDSGPRRRKLFPQRRNQIKIKNDQRLVDNTLGIVSRLRRHQQSIVEHDSRTGPQQIGLIIIDDVQNLVADRGISPIVERTSGNNERANTINCTIEHITVDRDG